MLELEPPRMIWNYLELPERNRIQLEPPGTRWIMCNKMNSATNWFKKQIHSKKRCVWYYFSIGYNVSNSYCDKDSILAGGTTWNRMEPVSADTKNALCTVSLAHRYSLPNTSCQKELHLRCWQDVPDPNLLYIYCK